MIHLGRNPARVDVGDPIGDGFFGRVGAERRQGAGVGRRVEMSAETAREIGATDMR